MTVQDTKQYGSLTQLRELYNRGAAEGRETIANWTVEGNEEDPVTLSVTDINSGETLTFWTSAVYDILQEAEIREESNATNPNYKSLCESFDEMMDMREILDQPIFDPQAEALPDSINQILGLD